MKTYLAAVMALTVLVFASPSEACIPKPPEEKVKELDKDGDKKVSFAEYEQSWIKLREAELKMLDRDREFSTKYEVGYDYEKQKKHIEELRSTEGAREVFNSLDKNKDGFITADEFKSDSEANLQKGC